MNNSDSLFLNGTGQRLSIIGIYKMLKRYANKIGIKKPVHPHLFRHSSITMMYESGMSEAQIKHISGHAKQSNALRTYINPNKDKIISKSQDALNISKPQPKLELSKPKPQPKDKDIIISELMEEVKKLRRELENQSIAYG